MNIKKNTALLIFTVILGLSSLEASAVTLIPTQGKTVVALSKELVLGLAALNVKPGAISPGTLNRMAVASFPITTGAVELPKSEIDHSGGLSFSGGNTRVALSSFIIDITATKPILTGLVIANSSYIGRVPLFNVDLSASSVVQKGKKVTIRNAGLTLSSFAANSMNMFFGVNKFTENLPIGIATITVTNSNLQ